MISSLRNANEIFEGIDLYVAELENDVIFATREEVRESRVVLMAKIDCDIMPQIEMIEYMAGREKSWEIQQLHSKALKLVLDLRSQIDNRIITGN